VNAEIRTSVIPNALTLPKEAVRRDQRNTGVFMLEDRTVAWRAISLGAASVTKVQVTSGVKEGDSVALPIDTPLEPGKSVTPVYR
jgi:multidrug efflux pump subunit AcrA (membrane-fusion protein)